MTAALRSSVGLARSLVIYRARPWRRAALSRFYAGFVGPGDLAFDIGAHAGNRTLALRRAGARVVALEPQAAFHGFLERTLPADVTLLRSAAGPTEGRARLAISRLHPTVSSLSEDFARTVGATPGFAHVDWDDAEEVAVTTLDALIGKFGVPRFVKIDVEGFEAEVLAGLGRPLEAVAFEALPAAPSVAVACIDRLEALGPHAYNAVRGEANAFALPDWTDAAGMRAALAAGLLAPRSGDIYARHRQDRR